MKMNIINGRLQKGVSGFVVFAAFGLTALPAVAADDVSFQLDAFPSGEDAAYYGGWQGDFFREAGINLSISRGYGTVDTATKLMSGSFQFGLTDLASVFLARARQQIPIKAVAVIYRQSPSSIFVLKSSGITTLKGLEGKRIGGPAGGGSRALFPLAAKRVGLDLTKVSWTNLEQATVGSQLIAKNIDAGTYYTLRYGAANAAAEKVGEEITVLPYFDSSTAIYSSVIATTEATIAKNPDLVRRFLSAVKRSFYWAKDHPEDACKAYLTKVPEDKLNDCILTLQAALHYAFDIDSEPLPWGRESPARTDYTWNAIADIYSLDKQSDPRMAFDTSFIPAQ